MAEYIERETFRDRLIELVRDTSRVHQEKVDAWILGGKVGCRPSISASVADSVLAADVAPVVHGRWEEKFFTNDRQRVCSVCHCTVRQPSYDKGETALFKYCPHCGARMDGDDVRQEEKDAG